MVCPSGDAESEAKLIDESALHSNVAGGVHGSHANCVSSQTDNAARATSAAAKIRKGTELDEAKRLVDAHLAVPANMQHAVDCWLKMSPEQRVDAYEMHELGCAGHSCNLTTEDSHKKSESTVITANMVDDRAARVLQRFFFYGYRRSFFFLLRVPSVLRAKAHPSPRLWSSRRPCKTGTTVPSFGGACTLRFAYSF